MLLSLYAPLAPFSERSPPGILTQPTNRPPPLLTIGPSPGRASLGARGCLPARRDRSPVGRAGRCGGRRSGRDDDGSSRPPPPLPLAEHPAARDDARED